MAFSLSTVFFFPVQRLLSRGLSEFNTPYPLSDAGACSLSCTPYSVHSLSIFFVTVKFPRSQTTRALSVILRVQFDRPHVGCSPGGRLKNYGCP